MQPPTSDVEYHYLRHIHSVVPARAGDELLYLAASLFILRLFRYLRGRNHPETAKGKVVPSDADSVESRRVMFRAELFLRMASGSTSIPLQGWKAAVCFCLQIISFMEPHLLD